MPEFPDFRQLLHRLKNGYFEVIPIPDSRYVMSIQASDIHFCLPKVKGEPSEFYSEFEIALFIPAIIHSKEWLNPTNTDWLKPYEDYWSDHKYGEFYSVGGNVPVNKVQEIYELACQNLKGK